ncbi:serine hydrolase domain-containing protein [Aquirufa sp. HETE-83D]|uniref:Serine hydrolase domain-containing protein n=1 Tax=Aquirufa esocilacus TaxID=3096513 RepID=A0ABW6DTR3_9BACT
MASCNNIPGHFFSNKSSIERRNDSLASLFDPQIAQQKAIKLDTFFKSLQKNTGFNGTVLVAQYGKVIYKQAFGVANKFTNDQLSTRTTFQLASVSKQFTAVSILQLVEKGKLSLEDRVEQHIPGFPYDSSITVRSLLTHKSGLPDYTFALDKYYDKKAPLTNAKVVQMMNEIKPGIDYRPNREFHYNNTNYMLLAYIVERLSGKDFRSYVKENIFIPAGMTESFVYDPQHPEWLKKAATGYVPKGGGSVVANFDHLDGVTGDKGIYSTVEDMFLWDQALNNEKVVKLSSLEQAFTPQHTKPKVLTTNYGLGWRMKQLENGEWLTYHTGWWHGFKNYYLHNPKDNSAIIILGNNANQSLSRINIVQSILYPEKSKLFIKGETIPPSSNSGGN